MKEQIGGQRIGAGGKMTVDMHGFGRSNHNLSSLWRSSMAVGTLVPFYTKIALPGDSIDIELACEALTLPTIGPLFGKFKIELHMFATPCRLYQGDLITNKLGIGLQMKNVKFPKIRLTADGNKYPNINSAQQINPSCVLAYNGIMGLGLSVAQPSQTEVRRDFNGGNYLAQLDIYKNYYANKQEKYGVFINNISNSALLVYVNVTAAVYATTATPLGTNCFNVATATVTNNDDALIITFGTWTNTYLPPDYRDLKIVLKSAGVIRGNTMFNVQRWDEATKKLTLSQKIIATPTGDLIEVQTQSLQVKLKGSTEPQKPTLERFQLSNIDSMRRALIRENIDGVDYFINERTTMTPYSTLNAKGLDQEYTKRKPQQGLLIKCYDNDLLNSWLDRESIDGTNGINQLTKIDTSTGAFTIDAFLLQRKVYDILNRINTTGGTYNDWLKATYSADAYTQINEPMYIGGLIKEIAFQEVISNASTNIDKVDQPLGTLGGRGVMNGYHKGGSIKAKFNEPMYITGFVSITPKLDYSQGNDWEVNLSNYNDLHQPGLDQIGFQNLITDQHHWAETRIDTVNQSRTFYVVGKQVAWQNYMTDINRVKGNFAVDQSDSFMCLTRRYEMGTDPNKGIIDMTTYIDPAKFNHIFANAGLDAQNFWVHIGINNQTRRVMSARQMPNL